MSRKDPSRWIASTIGRLALSQRASSPRKPDCARGSSEARYASSKTPAGNGSEGICHPLQLAAPFDDDVELHTAIAMVATHRQPSLRGVPNAADLLGRHHLEGIAEPGPRLRLHLAKDQRPSAPRDHVELVACDPNVRAENAI